MFNSYEEQLQLLIGSNNDRSIIVLDAEGHIISWNKGIQNISLYTNDEISGKYFSIFYPKEEPGNMDAWESLTMAAKDGKCANNGWLLKKDGTLFWAAHTLHARYNTDKKLIGFYYVITDKTESRKIVALESQLQDKTLAMVALSEELEKKARERIELQKTNIQQLKESEEKFQKAFQGSSAGISITRLSDGRYLDINNTFIEMTGFSREEIINHSSIELGIIVSISKREEILEKVREYGSAKDFEMTVRHKSGRIIEILSSVDTIVLNGEKFAINIIYDITERKKTELHLQSINKELEAFTYSVSHDLRAPLRAVNLYAQMLKEDFNNKLDDEGRFYVNTITKNATKMIWLIDDLLAFSQLGHQSLQKKEIDLNELIKDVLVHLQSQMPHKAEIKTGHLHTIYADYRLLYQVIYNLVSNAIKYSSKKQHPELTLNSEKTDEGITFSVADNGAGFDMKFVDKLFGVFKRLHTEEEFEGTGVGLAIVHRIITKHGGKVWAVGEKDKGATFYFMLPSY